MPVYNEGTGLERFHTALVAQLDSLKGVTFELLYCNDGSTDKTLALLAQFALDNERIRIISLSRNFGKEIATTAGLQAANGAAVITLDSDGQHPVELIAEFIARWQGGAKVVVGVRDKNQKEGFVKRSGSKLFYRILQRLTHRPVVPYSTDFRLIDRSVAEEFLRLTERNRMTRAQIDWLGYKSEYIHFQANPREHGSSGYSFKKLFKLAVSSFIAYSVSPLYFVAYVGIVVLPISLLVGIGMVVNALLGDPIGLHATGSAYVIVLLLFLVGVLLVSQGIIGLYLSQIHAETQNRPLYIIDKARSKRL